eukprot:578165-Amphidinium_carterae.1
MELIASFLGSAIVEHSSACVGCTSCVSRYKTLVEASDAFTIFQPCISHQVQQDSSPTSLGGVSCFTHMHMHAPARIITLSQSRAVHSIRMRLLVFGETSCRIVHGMLVPMRLLVEQCHFNPDQPPFD